MRVLQPSQAFDDHSPGWCSDCSLLRDSKRELPRWATPDTLTQRNLEVVNAHCFNVLCYVTVANIAPSLTRIVNTEKTDNTKSWWDVEWLELTLLMGVWMGASILENTLNYFYYFHIIEGHHFQWLSNSIYRNISNKNVYIYAHQAACPEHSWQHS